nr:hypothetical protein [Tanacetum cinerariifolium]
MMLPINSLVSYVKIAFNPTKSPHYKVIHIKFVDYVDDYDFRFGYCQIETYTRIWSLGGDRLILIVGNRYDGSSLTTFLTATSFLTTIPGEDLVSGDDNIPVSAVVPKIMVTRPRHAHSLNTKSNSTIRRHKTRSQSLKTSNSSPKVTATKAQVDSKEFHERSSDSSSISEDSSDDPLLVGIFISLRERTRNKQITADAIIELNSFHESNDVTTLQALVDKKKVVITEAAIRDALHLDDVEGVDCLPNEEIFTDLARMGYEKPSTKLTFYKAFFSSQWKFLIYTILQSMSAKRTSWNEFSSMMASAVICLSTCCKFNFPKYIFDSLVRNIDSSSKFYMYPRFIHLIIQNQLCDLSTHTTKYISPALTQKVFANMRRVGKGCSGVRTPLFEGMLVARKPKEQGDAEEQGNANNAAEKPVTAASKDDVEDQSIPLPTPPTLPPQQPQDISSTSQAQSPLPQPQSPTPTQPQGADFPVSLLQEALDACVT